MTPFKFFGSLCVALSLLMVVHATDSSVQDQAAGLATDVVKSGGLIQVYTYLGVSSEDTAASTFNEGETWFKVAPVTKPKTTTKTPTYSYASRTRQSAEPTVSEYVKQVDACLAEGKYWYYKNDTCIEY